MPFFSQCLTVTVLVHKQLLGADIHVRITGLICVNLERNKSEKEKLSNVIMQFTVPILCFCVNICNETW